MLITCILFSGLFQLFQVLDLFSSWFNCFLGNSLSKKLKFSTEEIGFVWGSFPSRRFQPLKIAIQIINVCDNLFPGNSFSKIACPDFAKACRKTALKHYCIPPTTKLVSFSCLLREVLDFKGKPKHLWCIILHQV